MKIAIATDWFAPRVGGIESQLTQLADGLGRRGHSVEVLTTTPHAQGSAHYSVVPLDVARLPGIDLAVSPRLFSLLRRELARHYDVVHAHVSVLSPVGYAAALVAHTLGLPTVVTFHSVLRAKQLLLRAASVLGGIGRSGVAWTAVSGLVAAQARSALRTDVSVLPNGIDLPFWSDSSRKSTMADRSRPTTFVSTMRLSRKKRPMELLRAFGIAATQSELSMRLVVVGVGPLSDALQPMLERLQRSNPHVSCELRGRQTRADLRALYARSDAFVLASRRESFGIAALEARAAGLPVIAMRGAGTSEFLTHEVDSLLCNDDRELADAIARLAGDSSLREALSHPTPLARFDWDAVLAEHEATYRRVARPTQRMLAPDRAVAPSM